MFIYIKISYVLKTFFSLYVTYFQIEKIQMDHFEENERPMGGDKMTSRIDAYLTKPLLFSF